jgi:hypothetical protein
MATLLLTSEMLNLALEHRKRGHNGQMVPSAAATQHENSKLRLHHTIPVLVFFT